MGENIKLTWPWNTCKLLFLCESMTDDEFKILYWSTTNISNSISWLWSKSTVNNINFIIVCIIILLLLSNNPITLAWKNFKNYLTPPPPPPPPPPPTKKNPPPPPPPSPPSKIKALFQEMIPRKTTQINRKLSLILVSLLKHYSKKMAEIPQKRDFLI